MTQSLEEFSRYGRSLAESGMNSLDSLSKGAQAVAAEAGEYTGKTLEEGSAAAAKLFAAKSLEDALEIQSAYLRHSYESLVAGATRFGNLYAELAGEACKPFEGVVARVG
ncbi:MAG TPA: phasin family protein [Mesorhizobium sp.]